MKIDIKIGIAFLCSLVCALLVFFLRTTPQGSLWNGYRIVYTDISLDSSYTLASLAEEGDNHQYPACRQGDFNLYRYAQRLLSEG